MKNVNEKPDSVTKDRDKYIGGSDIPAILGISPFTTRSNLLLFKAGLQDDDFSGNRYTEYGNIMEPKIRDYINANTIHDYKPDCLIKGVYRGNCDGADAISILEIKTTSTIHETAAEYSAYLSQLVFYMELYERKAGMLAVYERPENFDENFDRARLHLYEIEKGDPEVDDMAERVRAGVADFLTDLDYLRKHPFASDVDLPTMQNFAPLAVKAAELEERVTALKETEKELKAAKSELKKAMENHGVKKIELPGGTKVTLVPDGAEKVVKVFDESRFSEDHKDLYQEYTTEKIKKGRSGYVLITPPKK